MAAVPVHFHYLRGDRRRWSEQEGKQDRERFARAGMRHRQDATAAAFTWPLLSAAAVPAWPAGLAQVAAAAVRSEARPSCPPRL